MDPKKSSLRIVKVEITRKDWPKVVSIGRIDFLKVCVFNNLSGPIEINLYHAKELSETFWILKNCFLAFVMFDDTKPNRPRLFFTGNIAFLFSKACVFNNLRDVTERIL